MRPLARLGPGERRAAGIRRQGSSAARARWGKSKRRASPTSGWPWLGLGWPERAAPRRTAAGGGGERWRRRCRCARHRENLWRRLGRRVSAAKDQSRGRSIQETRTVREFGRPILEMVCAAWADRPHHRRCNCHISWFGLRTNECFS